MLSVIAADDERDAMRVANDTIYGLNASVFTNDVERARAVAGREGGKEGLLPFLETNAVILDGTPEGFA